MKKNLALLLLLLPLTCLAASDKRVCVVSMNVPTYPPLARTAHIQGTVILKVLINEKGDVTNATSISGHPILEDGALKNVKTWRFETPAEGKPVEITATYKYLLDIGNPPCPNFKFEGPATVEVYGAPTTIDTNTSKTK